jgi:hypothetical protein
MSLPHTHSSYTESNALIAGRFDESIFGLAKLTPFGSHAYNDQVPILFLDVSGPSLNVSALRLVDEHMRDEPKMLDRACNVSIKSKGMWCETKGKESTFSQEARIV